jgi:hypothetical protein
VVGFDGYRDSDTCPHGYDGFGFSAYICSIFINSLNCIHMNNMESNKGEIVMYQLNDVVELDVRLEDETVWLTQQQMSELFSVKENTVTYHIKEIYKTEELEKEGTARKIRVVRKEGNRNVRRTLDYYNLDMIISVGYKVNSTNNYY